MAVPIGFAMGELFELFEGQIQVFPDGYPLVICYIAIENGHRNSGFSHKK